MSPQTNWNSVVQLCLVAEEQIHAETTNSWRVRLENSATGKRSFPFVLADPFCPEEYEELRWYLEDYAVTDPFARGRAQKVSQSLVHYSETLLASLISHIADVLCPSVGAATPEGIQNTNIVLSIVGDGTTSSLHRFIWELLERKQIFNSQHTIFIARTPKIGADLPEFVEPVTEGKTDFNILYVAARPGLEEDIPYRAISRQIMHLNEALVGDRRVRFHFCRPGSWDRLCAILLAPDSIKYDLVHFDMHGGFAKSQGHQTAVLHFAPVGPASKKPIRKTATAVAKLLASAKVPFAILNACNSAAIRNTVVSNLACTLASYGIQYIAAMAYKVKTDAAVLAMDSLYQTMIQDPGQLLPAVQSARFQMRKYTGRTGRFGIEVPCEDDFNLVLYTAPASNGYRPSMVRCKHYPDVVPSSAQPKNHMRKPDSFQIQRIQDLDMLSLENAIQSAATIFMCGESGTGKSTLAQHLRNWWKTTDFAESVHYLDCLDHVRELSSQLAALNDEDATKSLGDALQNRNLQQTSTAAKPLYSHGTIFLLDNIEAYVDIGKSEQYKWKKLKDVIDSFTKHSRHRVIVWTRLNSKLIAARFPQSVQLEMTLPSPEEAFHVLRASNSFIASGMSSDKASQIEDIVKAHSMNLAFIHHFIPVLSKAGKDPYLALEEVWNNIQQCADVFSCLGKDNESSSAFAQASQNIATWPMETDLARRIILPFGMFRYQLPMDLRPWLYKLYETGAFSACRPRIEPLAVETGEIHVWALAEGWGSFPTDWTFENSFNKVWNCLSSLGFVTPNVESGWRLHPLLSYFLRSEIAKLSFRNPMRYQQKLEQTFWEFYENNAVEMIITWCENPKKAVQIIEDIGMDSWNLFEAIKLGLNQLIFPFRVMTAYDFLSSLNFLTMPQCRVRRWANLCGEVLSRFEQIVSHREWKTQETGGKLPTEDKRQLIFKTALHVALVAGQALETIHDHSAVIANAQRADLLARNLSQLADTIPAKVEQTLYKIRIQKARATAPSSWNSQTFLFFEDLLSSSIPDAENQGDLRGCKLARADLASHLSFEKRLIPTNHVLHVLIKKFGPELDGMLSEVFQDHMGLSQLGSLSSRDFFIRSGRPEGNAEEDYTARTYAAELSRRVEKTFESETPSNSRGYFADALLFAMDPEAVENGALSIFERTRLQKIYEKAKQAKHTELEAFSLQQLAIRAHLDGDESSAAGYFKKFEDIGGTKALPTEYVFDNDIAIQGLLGELSRTKFDTTRLGSASDDEPKLTD